MDRELIQEYLRRFDLAFSLRNNVTKRKIWGIDLSEEDLRTHQQELADRMLHEETAENDVFKSGALIFYGYRLGAVRLKGKNECYTRQGGYMDNAISTYSLDEILDAETEDDNPDVCTSHIIEWIINPGSNTDVAEAVLGKMIIPLVKNLCKITPPGKRMECTVVMPPISKEIEIQNWSDLFVGVRARDLQINIVNYGHLLTLDEDDRQYILQYQTNGFKEYVVIAAYEIIRGHNTCLGCMAFDVNDSDHQYILQDLKPISLCIDNRQERYEKKGKTEQLHDWNFISCKRSVNSGFNSFLGNHAASFGRDLFKLSDDEDDINYGTDEIRRVFHGNEALQVVEVCARLMNERNLYNIALGDLVYVANLLQRNKAFKSVSIGTTKDYKLGTYKQFAPFVDINKFPTIPSNFCTFSWRNKDKQKKLIPYYSLDVKKHTEKQIIESVVDYYDHCTAEMVADELLYLFKNGEDPSAFFVAKVFMYMSQMDTLEIESRNEILISIENVDDVVYEEIDKTQLQVSAPVVVKQRQPVINQPKNNARILETSIEDLDLTVRSYNCLRRAGIRTVRDITKRTQVELMKVRNLGKTSQGEVVEKIHKLGLKMADE